MLKKLFLLTLFTLLPTASFAGFTYEGTLFDSSGNPVQNSSITLMLEILSPTTNCILYGETQLIDTSTTGGYFSVEIGTGTLTATTSSYSLEQIFQNGYTFTALNGCTSGTTYSSGPNDVRKLKVSVTIASATEVLGTLTINPVPTAISAKTVGGFESKYLLRVDPATVASGATQFSAGQYTELMNLISGTSSQYLLSSAALGTVTSVVAGTGLTGGPITTSGALSVNVGLGAGQIPQLDGSGKLDTSILPATVINTTTPFTGDVTGTIVSNIVSSIRGHLVSPTSPVGGQVLRSTGSSWIPTYYGLQELRNSMGIAQLPASCGSNEALWWNSATDVLQCTAINLDGSNITSGLISPSRLGTGPNAAFVLYGNGTWAQPIDSRIAIASPNFYPLWNGTNLVEGLIKELGGKVGLGLVGMPNSNFEVSNSTNTANPTLVSISSYNSSVGGSLELRSSSANYGMTGYPAAGSTLGSIRGMGWINSGDMYSMGGEISFMAASVWGAGTRSTDILFKTTNVAATNEIMRLTSIGNIGIGTSTPTEKLHVLGNLRVQGSTDCTLGNGSGGTNCSSDIRLKSNVREIEDPLKKILSLRGVEFDWNQRSRTPGTHAIGVIAQEVEQEFPTAVITDQISGYKKVDYAVLVAPLIEAVKVLSAEKASASAIKDLEARLVLAEKENLELKARLQRLEKALSK